MAKGYRLVADASIPRVLAQLGDDETGPVETEGVNYARGSYITSDQMTPNDRKRAEKGELSHILQEVDEEEAVNGVSAQTAEQDYGIFIPEHEAERHALEMYGHGTVSKEQELELLSSSADYARQHQEAAAQHGLDRRPVQEHFAQDRPRVPEEYLRGGETRAGLPHNRGPEGSQQLSGSDEENAESDQDSEDESPALRQRPGAAHPEETEGLQNQEPAVQDSSDAAGDKPPEPTTPEGSHGAADSSGHVPGQEGQ